MNGHGDKRKREKKVCLGAGVTYNPPIDIHTQRDRERKIAMRVESISSVLTL